MEPSVPKLAGVKYNCAPRALRIFFLSSLADSGIAKHNLYPFAAAIIAKPIPVLPLVASKMIFWGVKSPLSSAPLIIKKAVRSLMEPPGFALSSLANIFTFLLGLSF